MLLEEDDKFMNGTSGFSKIFEEKQERNKPFRNSKIERTFRLSTSSLLNLKRSIIQKEVQ